MMINRAILVGIPNVIFILISIGVLSYIDSTEDAVITTIMVLAMIVSYILIFLTLIFVGFLQPDKGIFEKMWVTEYKSKKDRFKV